MSFELGVGVVRATASRICLSLSLSFFREKIAGSSRLPVVQKHLERKATNVSQAAM